LCQPSTPFKSFCQFPGNIFPLIDLNPQVIHREGVSKTEKIISQKRTEKRGAI